MSQKKQIAVKSNGKTYYFQGYNKPRRSWRRGKKRVVLARVGDRVKVIHYGSQGYSDFRYHRNPKRRSNYRKRHRAIKLKSGQPAYQNKLQASYWAYRDLW